MNAKPNSRRPRRRSAVPVPHASSNAPDAPRLRTGGYDRPRARRREPAPLGPVESWPQELTSAFRLIAANPAPAIIWWGRDFVQLKNDACTRLFGCGRSFGLPANIQDDLWNALGTSVSQTFECNTATLALERRVRAASPAGDRELYGSFSITPIRDSQGAAIGVMAIGTDDTRAVLARQRSAVLSRLHGLARAGSLNTACEWGAAALASEARDVPFALLYLADDSGTARLVGSAGALPKELDSAFNPAERPAPWPLHRFEPGEMHRRATLPPPYRQAARDADDALVLPVHFHAQGVRATYLVAALPRRRPFDNDFREFLTSAAALIAAGLAAAAASEAARDGADASRNEFLAMLAHELRNPLAPIRSATELLSFADSNPMSLPHARAIRERQLGQLVRLVDDLLDVSRLSRGTLELKRAPIDLRTAAASAIESVRPLVDAARHTLSVHLPKAAVPLDGDHARLTQALANVLTNASQYTHPGGHIDLTMEVVGRTARIRVTDDGIGVDAALVPRMFDMFTQGEQRSGEPRRGLGIGLTVARTMIEMHGGAIDVASPGRNRGSEFVIALPMRAELVEPPSTNIYRAGNARRKILVADDNVDAAAAMAEILGVMGHDVRTAKDGLEALEVAEHFRPDVILLDIGMPHLDGYEVCRRIRQRAWGRKLPVYAVTGWGQASDRQRTREAGFDAHLVKPVSIEAINALIDDADIEH